MQLQTIGNNQNLSKTILWSFALTSLTIRGGRGYGSVWAQQIHSLCDIEEIKYTFLPDIRPFAAAAFMENGEWQQTVRNIIEKQV